MISQKQKKILAFSYSSYDALICDGAVRSGKTSIMTVAFVDWAMREFNERRFGICGKTVDSAVKNIVDPFRSMILSKERYAMRWSRSEKLLTVRRGRRVNYFEVFGGKDEASFMLIQGRTLGGVLLDEVVLMPESFVNQALARCSVDGSRLWFSCNPGNPNHWFKEQWIDRRKEHNALYLHFEMTDNPALSAKTLARYQSMYSGVFYDRYIRGMWVAAEGLVYPAFSVEKNVTSSTPWLDINGTTRMGTQYFISIDYGIVNPFSAGLWAVYKGVAYRWREYYYTGRDHERGQRRDDEGHYAEIEKLADDLPIQMIVIDPSASSFVETIYRHGKFGVINAVNEVIPGIATVDQLLNCGRLKIGTDCKDCIDEFRAYSWDRNETGDLERVVKEHDHAMDETRYFCHTILRSEFGWLNWG